jgi:hypothetical protein
LTEHVSLQRALLEIRKNFWTRPQEILNLISKLFSVSQNLVASNVPHNKMKCKNERKKYVEDIIFLLMWYFVDSLLKNEIIFAVFAVAENRRERER